MMFCFAKPVCLVAAALIFTTAKSALVLEQLNQDCPYFDVTIDGVSIENGACFTSTQFNGITSGKVEGQYKENVVIWDPDAPCGPKKAFIHYAGSGEVVAPMTAGAGSTVHTYIAAMFDVLPIPEGVVGSCYDFDVEYSHHCSKKWRVARYGSVCPV